jgi:hypothetical protein
VVLAVLALAAAGCGSGGGSGSGRASSSGSAQVSSSGSASSTSSRTTTGRRTAPSVPATPVPSHAPRPPDAQTVAVIRHWADALRRGDVRGAARFFQIPSIFAPSPDQEVTIHSLADAEAANAGLPCGAKLISVTRVGGPLVQALFRLTGRPGRGGSACNPGAGQTARTNFVIQAGRIRVWLRAPDQPGDNQPPLPSGGGGGGGPVV